MRSPWSPNVRAGSFLFHFLPVIYRGGPLGFFLSWLQGPAPAFPLLCSNTDSPHTMHKLGFTPSGPPKQSRPTQETHNPRPSWGILSLHCGYLELLTHSPWFWISYTWDFLLLLGKRLSLSSHAVWLGWKHQAGDWKTVWKTCAYITWICI